MDSSKTGLIVYGRPACPMVPPVLNALKTVSADYRYVDINQDWEAREQVRAINNGNESVPTLMFADGSTLTEPGLGTLRAKLAEQGYETAALEGPAAAAGYIMRNSTYLLFLFIFLAILLAALIRG